MQGVPMETSDSSEEATASKDVWKCAGTMNGELYAMTCGPLLML